MSDARIRGVLAPVVTPFDASLRPDRGLFIEHCEWLLSAGCGLAVFGTNSEANSLSVAERLDLLEAAADAGLDPSRMMPGTGSCALPDAVALSRRAVECRCGGVLMLPPFYYKDVNEEGLYRFFAEVIEQVGDSRLRVYLYHIPPVAVVGISAGLVERLLRGYPDTIAGMKDSSGDWQQTSAMLSTFAAEGFDVFVGSEAYLLANMQSGGAGCISATANVNPAAIHRLYREWEGEQAPALQAALNTVRDTFSGHYLLIAAMKAAIAHFRNEPRWRALRPPLAGLTDSEQASLIASLGAIGFRMPVP